MEHQIELEQAFKLASKTQNDDLFHLAMEAELRGDGFVSIGSIRFSEIETKYQKQVEKEQKLFKTANLNSEGIALEKAGNIDAAINVYEENIAIGYPAAHSFERLRILYKKRKDFANLERVIRRKGQVYNMSEEDIENEVIKYCAPKSTIKKNYPTRAYACPSPDTTIEDKFYTIVKRLPEFDFYKTTPKEEVLGIDSNSPTSIYFKDFVELRKLKNEVQSYLKQASEFELKGRYDKSCEIYELLIANRIHDTVPYDKLASIYIKAGLQDEAIRVLNVAITFFSCLYKKQYEYIHYLASKYGVTEIKGIPLDNYGRITYFNGAFTLYREYPIINKWRDKLKKQLA